MERDEIKLLRNIEKNLLNKIIESNTSKKYKISKLLDCGEFSCVFLALDENNNWVALKVTDNINKLEEIECLLKLRGLCGENILCYIESFNIYFLDKDWLVIVTEFLSGYISLNTYLKSNTLTKNKKITIMKNIVKIINFIHKFGILHNDLNKENIMIDPNTLNIKIIDFGNCSSMYKIENPDELMKLEIESIKDLF
jgi:serine/threonine protein kinase